jgi:hypothetical protein
MNVESWGQNLGAVETWLKGNPWRIFCSSPQCKIARVAGATYLILLLMGRGVYAEQAKPFESL